MTSASDREIARRWRENHPDRYAETKRKSAARLAASPELQEKHREYSRKWQQENRDKFREAQRKYRSRPSVRIACYYRTRLSRLIYGGDSPAMEKVLGCTIEMFRARLRDLMKPGMTWLNYGTHWEIDHIKPCCQFDLTDDRQFRECFHYTNLQPLTKAENKAKRMLDRKKSVKPPEPTAWPVGESTTRDFSP